MILPAIKRYKASGEGDFHLLFVDKSNQETESFSSNQRGVNVKGIVALFTDTEEDGVTMGSL